MTKAEIVAQISRQSGIEKTVVMTVIESFMGAAYAAYPVAAMRQSKGGFYHAKTI